MPDYGVQGPEEGSGHRARAPGAEMSATAALRL
jgi:hypothetical protein